MISRSTLSASLLAPFLAGAAFPAMVFAQEQPAMGDAAIIERQVIDAIDDSTLLMVLSQLSAEATALDEEGTTLRVEFPSGVIAITRRMACNEEESCKGLMLTAYMPVPENTSQDRAAETLERFNLESLVASVVTNQLGEHVVKTYVILDGGITTQNLAIWIGLFSESVRAYQQALYGPA